MLKAILSILLVKTDLLILSGQQFKLIPERYKLIQVHHQGRPTYSSPDTRKLVNFLKMDGIPLLVA